jgi:ketosteroid isomerase-like protein
MEDDQIRAVIRSWEKAIQNGNLDGILENHTSNVLMFDVPEPMQARGLEEYRRSWDLFFEYGKPSADVFAIENL